jgi:hypothetical protein
MWFEDLADARFSVCPHQEEVMLRKLILAATATAALGLTALAPTAASAHWNGQSVHRGFHHHGFWAPRYAFAAPARVYGNPCIRERWVRTPWGMRLHRVNVCY